jgi:hypothetical protein
MLGGGHIEVNLRCDHFGVHVVPSCHDWQSVGPCSIPGLCRGRGYHGLYVINATDPACVGFVVFPMCGRCVRSYRKARQSCSESCRRHHRRDVCSGPLHAVGQVSNLVPPLLPSNACARSVVRHRAFSPASNATARYVNLPASLAADSGKPVARSSSKTQGRLAW